MAGLCQRHPFHFLDVPEKRINGAILGKVMEAIDEKCWDVDLVRFVDYTPTSEGAIVGELRVPVPMDPIYQGARVGMKMTNTLFYRYMGSPRASGKLIVEVPA